MPYFKLQIKQVLKSKFTWLSLLAILLVSGYFWLQLYSVRNNESFDHQQARENLVTQKGNIKYYRKELKRPGLSAENKKELTHDLKENQENARENQTLITALNAKDWQTAYPVMIKQEKDFLADARRNHLGSWTLAMCKRDLLFVQFLAKQKIAKELDYPITGGLFMFNMLNDILPLLIVLAIIFVLTKLYCSGYVERMQLGNLLPQKGQVLTNWISGTTTGTMYLLLIFLLVLILPSLVCGIGNLNYPMMSMDAWAKVYTLTPLYQVFLPSLVLFVLSLAFIASAVLLISQLFRSRLITLLVATLVLGGGMALPQFVVGVRKFAQYVPMTYFSALPPVTGMFGLAGVFVLEDGRELITYPQVNFTNGIVTLLVATGLMLVFNYLLTKRLEKGRKTQ